MSWLHGVTAQRACPRSAPRPPVRTCPAPWRSPAPHLQEGGSACSPGEVTMQTGIRGWRRTEVTCGLKGAPSALQPLPPAVAPPSYVLCFPLIMGTCHRTQATDFKV